MAKKILIGLAFLFLVCGIVLGRDIYVRRGAAGNGTRENPFGELWKACETALRGDVIHIAEGRYFGKGGSGSFIVTVPKLTLAGGYKPDFSERNPFKYLTVLERDPDYRGDYTGLPDGIIEGKQGTDHSGLVIDGLVLDSASRNSYHKNGDLNPLNSWKGRLLGASSPNIKIRNCILLNPYGEGIYMTWQGEENEVSNCVILNAFYNAISTRSAQPGSVIRISGNTIGFTYEQPGKGGGSAIFIGLNGKTIIENNIIMFSEEFAVFNGFGNDETVLRGNVFFQSRQGMYKYMDSEGRNLVVWKPGELADLNANAEFYALLEAGANTAVDPALKPDKPFFERFSNFAAASLGNYSTALFETWRKALGLPPTPDPRSAAKSWAPLYPLDSVIPGLVAAGSCGVQTGTRFLVYQSAPETEKPVSYESVSFAIFKKGAPGVRDLAGKPVQFSCGLGPNQTVWFDHIAGRADYRAVMLPIAGEDEFTRDCVYGYLLKGSEAEKNWDKLYAKRDRYQTSGIIVRGRAFYLKNESYPYPVGVIIDEVSAP